MSKIDDVKKILTKHVDPLDWIDELAQEIVQLFPEGDEKGLLTDEEVYKIESDCFAKAEDHIKVANLRHDMMMKVRLAQQALTRRESNLYNELCSREELIDKVRRETAEKMIAEIRQWLRDYEDLELEPFIQKYGDNLVGGLTANFDRWWQSVKERK